MLQCFSVAAVYERERDVVNLDAWLFGWDKHSVNLFAAKGLSVNNLIQFAREDMPRRCPQNASLVMLSPEVP
jgi:hypothetical protein